MSSMSGLAVQARPDLISARGTDRLSSTCPTSWVTLRIVTSHPSHLNTTRNSDMYPDRERKVKKRRVRDNLRAANFQAASLAIPSAPTTPTSSLVASANQTLPSSTAATSSGSLSASVSVAMHSSTEQTMAATRPFHSIPAQQARMSTTCDTTSSLHAPISSPAATSTAEKCDLFEEKDTRSSILKMFLYFPFS